MPGELEERIRRFVDCYNYERYHESLNNLTPADVYYGRGQAILNKRETIKQRTLAMRRRVYYDNQSKHLNLMSLNRLLIQVVSSPEYFDDVQGLYPAQSKLSN